MSTALTRIALLARTGTSPWYTYSRIAQIYTKFGYSARMVELLSDAKEVDVLFTHNINGLNDKDLCGLLDAGVKVVTFIDTPYNKVDTLQNTDPRVIFVFTDDAYISVASEINRGRNRIISHPLEITIQESGPVKPIAERPFDILFAGRLVDFDKLDSEYTSSEKKRAVKIVERAIDDNDHHIHELAMESLSFRKKIGLYQHSFIGNHFMNYCWRLSHSLRKQRKLIVMNELKQMGKQLKCCFISNSPDQIRKLMGEDHTYHDFMPWKDVVALMHDSKMVINTMPGHIDCLHEHMVEAMISGAVCVSDENRKTRKVLDAGRDFISFNYKQGNLAQTLTGRTNEKLQLIADAGKAKMGQIVRPEIWVDLLEKLR